MLTSSEQELDLTRLVVIVMFLIVGSIYARTFFHNYVSKPASDVALVMDRCAQYRALRALPDLPLDGPANPHYTQALLMREYLMIGDKRAKQRLVQNTKRSARAKHPLAIWGSFAAVCISIIAVVGAGLPVLEERLLERRYRA